MQLYANRFKNSKNGNISRRIQLKCRTRDTFHSVILQSIEKTKHRKEGTWCPVSHHLIEQHAGGG